MGKSLESLTYAHTSKKDLLLLPPALAEPCTYLSRPSSTQRMAECDCASPDIHLRRINAKHVDAIDGHRSESLVQFDHIDIVLKIEVKFTKQLRDCEGGTNSHYPWCHTCDCRAAELGQDRLVHSDRL